MDRNKSFQKFKNTVALLQQVQLVSPRPVQPMSSDSPLSSKPSCRFYTMSGERVKKCGWLKKQSNGLVRGWQKRWFVLRGDSLYYYSTEDDSRVPIGGVMLKNNDVVEQPVTEPDKYIFEIISGNPSGRIDSAHSSYVLYTTTDQERKDWVRVIRDTMFSSVGGAIFGQPLDKTLCIESTLTGHKRKIPIIVEKCTEFIMKFGLDMEGIFRHSGRKVLILELKEKFDRGQAPDLLTIDSGDVSSVASLLKLYLSELPESIIPFSHYETVMKVFTRQEHKLNPDEATKKLSDILKTIPGASYNLLQFVCRFLSQISANNERNKMTNINLATIFLHAFIRPEVDDPALLMGTTDIRIQTTFFLINQSHLIFQAEFTPTGELEVDQLLDLDPAEELTPPIPSRLTTPPKPARDLISNDIIDSVESDIRLLPTPLNPEESREHPNNARGSRAGRVFANFDGDEDFLSPGRSQSCFSILSDSSYKTAVDSSSPKCHVRDPDYANLSDRFSHPAGQHDLITRSMSVSSAPGGATPPPVPMRMSRSKDDSVLPGTNIPKSILRRSRTVSVPTITRYSAELEGLLQTPFESLTHMELVSYTTAVVGQLHRQREMLLDLRMQLRGEQAQVSRLHISYLDREEAIHAAVAKVMDLQEKLSEYQATYGTLKATG